MRYEPGDGTWIVLPTAGNETARAAFSAEIYGASVEALRLALCQYFSHGACDYAQGKFIRRIDTTKGGGKVMKVRWALPGTGKRGGLRMAIVVYCDVKRVVVAESFIRKDDPTDKEFTDAAAQAD